MNLRIETRYNKISKTFKDLEAISILILKD